MVIKFLRARGTGEVLNGEFNFLTQFSREVCHRAPDVFEMGEDLPYPASITMFNPEQNPQGVSLKTSKEQGVANLIEYLETHEGRFFLLGYSLGGIVMTEGLWKMILSMRTDLLKKIAGVMLVANPLRAEGDSFESHAPGYGIYGPSKPFPRLPFPIYEIANPVDGICSTAGDSPLRTLTDVVDAFTFAVGGGWGEDLLDKLRTARWQLWGRKWWENPFRVIARWTEAIGLVDGYIHTDQHNGWYWRSGVMIYMASHLVKNYS